MILYTVSWFVVISLPFRILFIVTCGAIFLAYVVSALKHCYVEVKNRNSNDYVMINQQNDDDSENGENDDTDTP